MVKLTGIGVSGPDIFYTARIKSYPGGRCEALVYDKTIFGDSGWEARQGARAKEPRVKDGGHDVARVVRRARVQVRDIALCTPFRWFVTPTLDPTRMSRYDAWEAIQHLNHWLDNQVRRKGLVYVLMPEQHKGGAIHLHGFFNNTPGARDSGAVSLPGQEAPRRPRNACQRAKWLEDGGKLVYSLPGWSRGFIAAIELHGECDRVVSHVCKYIGKEPAPSPNGDSLEPRKIGGHWYYPGGALGRPQVTYAEPNFRQTEQGPGVYRFDLPQAGISFVQFRFQTEGDEGSEEPAGEVAESRSEVPLAGAVR